MFVTNYSYVIVLLICVEIGTSAYLCELLFQDI